MVQVPAIWDKQQGIYEEIKRRKDIEAFMFVVPELDAGGKSGLDLYNNNYFINEYKEAIKVYNEKGKLIDLRPYNLDYLFYPRPYDEYLPEKIRSVEAMNYVKCCYVPYGYSGSDSFNSFNILNEFFDHMYFMFMDSLYTKRLMIKARKNEIKKGIQKVLYLGYPCLQPYINMDEIDKSHQIVTWTPRWSYDAECGGSHFLEYRDKFIELCKFSNEKFIFRPHPLMFNELLAKGVMSVYEEEQYILELKQNNVDVELGQTVRKPSLI